MVVKLRTRKLQDGRHSYYLDIHFGKERRHESLGLYHDPRISREENEETRRKADERRLERDKELARAGVIVKPTSTNLPFAEYFETVCDRDWRAGRQQRMVTDGTKKSWKAALTKVLMWEILNKQELLLGDINEQWLEQFKIFLLTKAGIVQSTACTHFQKVGSCLEEAVKEGLITHNPARNVEPISMPDMTTPHLTLSQVEKLVNTRCGLPEVKRSFLFSLHTGLRPVDIRNLTWANVRKTETGYKLVFTPQKTKKTVAETHKPLNENAIMLLGEIRTGVEHIFALPDGKTVNKYVKRWCKAAGIEEDVTYKVSRHSFATIIYEQTGDIYVVSKLLDHATAKTSERYAKVTDKRKEDAIRTMPIMNINMNEFQENEG